MKIRYIVADIYLCDKRVSTYVGRSKDLGVLIALSAEYISSLPGYPYLDVRILKEFERNEIE